MNKNICITIGREYGSGGKDIGKLIAEKLSLPFYDNELITMAAKENHMSEDMLKTIDEKAGGSLLYTLAVGSSAFAGHAALGYNIPINDTLFILQSDIIKKVAEKGGCVIVGRCADYVLRENPNCMSVFVYADLSFRIPRIAQRHDVSEKEAADAIAKTDRRRANYYNFYTGHKWGRHENYDLALNSAPVGIENAAQVIIEYAERFQRNPEAKEEAPQMPLK